MRVYKKKTIRRMKWYGVILVLSGIPLGIGILLQAVLSG